jgi:regulator of protease activity HflC (stomatin/prohibitin superfamily)
LNVEGQRQSAILRAEGAKQAQILEAEGRREAAFRDAEARERSAAAEAKATEVVSEAIANGEVASIADKYLRALTEIAHSPNQKVLMLPVEVTSVLGTLVGIAEIVNATFGGAPSSIGGSPPPRPTVPASARNP